MSSSQTKILGAILRDIRFSWKQLAITDLIYKVLAFVLLTPIVGILFRVLVALSGRTVVADEDIIKFLLEPLGWACIIVVGMLWITIVALEQAALMGVLSSAGQARPLRVIGALRFASANAWPVVRVTARIMVLTLLAAAPFLAAAGLVYLSLLTEFDINYYLKEKPPAFLAAVGIGAVIAVGLAIVILRLATSWFYALPLVLFERVATHRALRESRDRANGHRRTLILWVIGWLAATFILSAIATGTVIMVAKFFVPRAVGSLGLVLFIVGATVVAWALVNLFANLLSTTTFAVMFLRLYTELGSPSDIEMPDLAAGGSQVSEKAALLTAKRLVLGIIIGVVVSATIGVVAIGGVRTEDNTQVMAHRGASAAAPENTMAAVKQAVEEGADWVEIDVQETADGEVVVFHDSDFKKVAGRDLKIWDATLEDLNDIDIGSWFGSEFKGERVPTLREVLDFCRGKIRVNIELKYYGHDKQLEQKVADLVDAAGMQSNIVVMSLKQAGIEKMKKLRPDWRTGLLTAMVVGDLTRADADFLAVNAGIATRSFIRSAHDRKKEVYVWTVNDVVTMSTMMGRGVEALITDKPALARNVLKERTKMSSVERLLIELAGVLGVQQEIAEQ